MIAVYGFYENWSTETFQKEYLDNIQSLYVYFIGKEVRR